MSDTYTTNYGLVKIEAGTTGWADKANGNMDTIDTQIKTISTIAGGSGTVNSGVAGSLAYYPSTDTVVDDASGLAYVPLTGALSVTHSGGAEPAISVVASGATATAAVVKFSGTVNTDKTNSLTITPLNGGVDSGTTIMASTTDTANCPLYLAAKGVTRLILDGTTNQVQTAGAGTAGTPNLVINADVNTGIFAPAADTLAVSTAGVERTRIDSSGNVGIGGTPGYKLDVVGDPNSDILNITATADGTLGIRISPVGASSNSAKIIATRNGTDTDITIRTGGADTFKVAANSYITAPGVYTQTTASSANVYVDSSGNVMRSTSSRKYKKDIQTLSLADAKKLLQLVPMIYKSKSPIDDPDELHYGFVAEDVDPIDPMLVSSERNKVTNAKTPDGVQYERVVVPLLKLVQDLEARVKVIEAR